MLIAALLLTALPDQECRAETINVRSGSVVMNLSPAALAALNYGSDPAIGALIFEEFFRGDADRSRTGPQLLADQIVPGFTAIPPVCLKFEVNGDSVTNLNPTLPATRNRRPSTFSYDPSSVTASASGGIGLTGTLRFIGDFTGGFILGDFVLRYNLPSTLAEPNRGWVFVNNLYFVDTPAFETRDVTTTAANGRLIISGKLTISRELDLFFFPGDRGKIVGDFRFETPEDNALLQPPPEVALLPSGQVALTFPGRGNRCYRVQYSSDLGEWITLPEVMAGTGQPLTWVDSGPPLTPSLPSSAARRFYRLLHD